MVQLRRMEGEDVPVVSALSVTEEQYAFVDPITETLSETASFRDSFVIEDSGTIVGFFQIDKNSSSDKVPGSLDLHEVAIDVAYQGQGYGKAFMGALGPFLRAVYPNWEAVCLTVNCKNKIAYQVYLNGGFSDTGRLYLQGRSGPQHIMVRDLK